jgi:hypothetical protein
VASDRYCSQTRADGQPCGGRPLEGRDTCFAHDPEREDERQAARAKGGQNSATAVRLRALVPPRLIPLFDRLETVMEELHDGSIEPKVATAMAGVARAMVAVCQAGELEARLRALEEGKQT